MRRSFSASVSYMFALSLRTLPFPSFSPLSFLVVTVFFSTFFCPTNGVHLLKGYTCAKKGAQLPNGFSLLGEDHILMNPSALDSSVNNRTTEPQILAFLPNAKDNKKLHFTIIIIDKDQFGFQKANTSCYQFFKDHIHVPENVSCSFGKESEVTDDHHPAECSKEKGTNCTSYPASCTFHMGSVKHLPNARYFFIKMWTLHGFNDLSCRWKATIDKVRVLMKNSEIPDKEHSEKCWEFVVLSDINAYFLYAVIFGLFFITIISIILSIMYMRKRQKLRNGRTAKPSC